MQKAVTSRDGHVLNSDKGEIIKMDNLEDGLNQGLEGLLSPLGVFSGPAAKLISALIVLIIGIIVIKIVSTVAEHAVSRSSLDQVVHKFIHNTIKVAGWVLLIIMVISDRRIHCPAGDSPGRLRRRHRPGLKGQPGQFCRRHTDHYDQAI